MLAAVVGEGLELVPSTWKGVERGFAGERRRTIVRSVMWFESVSGGSAQTVSARREMKEVKRRHAAGKAGGACSHDPRRPACTLRMRWIDAEQRRTDGLPSIR